MSVCDVVSDWPLQTCNIILHVSAPSIGYTGPALHQAVALDGNIININTGMLEKQRTSLRRFISAFNSVLVCLGVKNAALCIGAQKAPDGKCAHSLTIGYYKVR